VGTLVEFCASVASAAPKTPFLYYHYPGITGVNLPVYDFFEKAHGAIPTLRGTLPCLMESRRDEDA
jgi:N-acetylneuraminate lyase